MSEIYCKHFLLLYCFLRFFYLLFILYSFLIVLNNNSFESLILKFQIISISNIWSFQVFQEKNVFWNTSNSSILIKKKRRKKKLLITRATTNWLKFSFNNENFSVLRVMDKNQAYYIFLAEQLLRKWINYARFRRSSIPISNSRPGFLAGSRDSSTRNWLLFVSNSEPTFYRAGSYR